MAKIESIIQAIIQKILKKEREVILFRLEHDLFDDEATRDAYQEYNDPEFLDSYTEWSKNGLSLFDKESDIPSLESQLQSLNDDLLRYKEKL